mmetsp:Transcript_92848/g.178258  ORF Transcript_92848/g.178258 Transcript_92848/m.178258 type:complete len:247 (+) Transcript_92848:108-848(+)
MQYIKLLVVASALVASNADISTTWKSNEIPNRSTGLQTKAAETVEPIRLEHASVLGLQRSVQLSRARVPPVEDPSVVSTTPAAPQGDLQSRGQSTQGKTSTTIPEVRKTGMLSLQQSTKLSRSSGPPVEEAATPKESAKGKPEVSKPDPSLRKFAGLGLQRSTTLSRRQAPTKEEDGKGKGKAGKASLPPEFDDALESLSFEDVSVLGLQRSVKVVRGGSKEKTPASPQVPSKAVSEEAAFSVVEV